MRVAELFWEPRRSGITGHVLGLARSLPRDRVEPFFIVPEHLEESRRELEATGARVLTLPLENKLFPRAALDRLPALLRRERPFVLHVHSLEAGLFGHHVRRAARIPRIVFTPHTDTIRRQSLFPIYRALWRRYGRETDILLASTEAQRERLVALGVSPRDRVLLGPTGVRSGESALPRDHGARSAARARLGWPPEGKLVGQVGRLVAQKDPLAVVRLAAALGAALDQDTKVVLVGDGPLEADARALARELGVEHRVHFAGYVSDLESVYAALDVLVLASRWEGLSVVLLEALGRGLAVVAAPNEGNEAVVRDGVTGRIAADPDAFARAVTDLLEHPAEAARLGDRARALVLETYDERACAARIADAYFEAARRPVREKKRPLRFHAPGPVPTTVSVAIPTYRREGELLRCIEGLRACEPSPLEILVVDQTERHEPATEASLRAFEARGEIRWIHHAPPSLTGARNRALLEARGELILMLDDEVEPPRDLVAKHARHFADPTIGMTGGGLEEPGFAFEPYPFVLAITRSGRKLANYGYPHPCDALGAPGGNAMIRRDLACAIGGWDERLSRAARGEDAELSQRVLRAGARIFFDPEARVVHRPAPRGGTRTQAGFAAYFEDYYHDDTYFFLRHQDARWLPLFFLRHAISTLRASLGHRAREFPGFEPGIGHWPALLGAFARGFQRGLTSARRARRAGPLGTYSP